LLCAQGKVEGSWAQRVPTIVAQSRAMRECSVGSRGVRPTTLGLTRGA